VSNTLADEASRPAAARTPSQQARRDRILAAAQRLLHEREFEQIQVRDVAEDAGVALGTLYRYFPSKELLYAHALLAWSETFEARVLARSKDTDSDADRLRAALRGAVRAYERAPSFFRLLTLLEVATDPGVRAVFSAFADRFTMVLRGVVRDTDEHDAGTIAFIAGAVLGSGLRSWSLHGTPIRTVCDRIDDTVDLLFSGAPGSATRVAVRRQTAG
jgi:AcrR family transcriptional regulator